MEHISKQIAKVKQHQKDSEVSLNNSLIRIGDRTFLKTRTGELTKKGITEAIGKLASNFKKLDDSFFSILADRVRKNGFDDESLNKAIETVIDNFHYNEPKVADIISLSPNIELLSYYQVIRLMDQTNRKAFEIYRPIRVPGTNQSMYTLKVNIDKYNLNEIIIK